MIEATLQPGDLYIIEGGRKLKVIVHPMHENGYYSTSLDDGVRPVFRGYFPDERRNYLLISGRKCPILMFQGDLAEVA